MSDTLPNEVREIFTDAACGAARTDRGLEKAADEFAAALEASGWVCVPTYPTDAMIDAFFARYGEPDCGHYTWEGDSGNFAACYLDMLSTFSEPQSTPTPNDICERLEKRMKGLESWLVEQAPECFDEMKHLDEGSPERVYWHYGRMVALRDVVALLTASNPKDKPDV